MVLRGEKGENIVDYPQCFFHIFSIVYNYNYLVFLIITIIQYCFYFTKQVLSILLVIFLYIQNDII
jgi:hypothetical protein